MSAINGAQLQVKLRGIADVPLLHPQGDSFFRKEFRRHTNFSSAEAEQATGTAFALGRKGIQTKFDRQGDLLSQVYLHAEFDAILPNSYAEYSSGTNYASWTNGLGYAMLDDVSCTVGNKPYDAMDGQFMYQREQVAAKSDRKLGQAVGWYSASADRMAASMRPQKLNIPLQFAFCNFLEHSLATIGLYWHDIIIKLSLKAQSDLIYVKGTLASGYTTSGLTDLHFICNFQYLDATERSIFANESMEYVFIQHQDLGDETWTTSSGASKTFNIRFSFPVTDIMWAPTGGSNRTEQDWTKFFCYDGVSYTPFNTGPVLVQEPFKSAQIFFNNQARTIELSSSYLRQIPQHRAQYRIGNEANSARVYGYCFGTDVNDFFATGEANYSRYDQATIKINLWQTADSSGYLYTTSGYATSWATNCTVKFHARNFQLGKMKKGTFGVKFAS